MTRFGPRPARTPPPPPACGHRPKILKILNVWVGLMVPIVRVVPT